jgi:hypothetical protein
VPVAGGCWRKANCAGGPGVMLKALLFPAVTPLVLVVAWS